MSQDRVALRLEVWLLQMKQAVLQLTLYKSRLRQLCNGCFIQPQ